MKEIEEYTNKEIGKSCSLLRRKNIVKMSILPECNPFQSSNDITQRNKKTSKESYENSQTNYQKEKSESH